MHEKFRKIAERISIMAGSPRAFLFALFFVMLWAVSGPFFNFSDTWQLVINTGTTIVTFLMVFLIQNAQNRDSVAVQLKLDELIRSVQGARMGMMNIDQLSDADLRELRRQFQDLAERNGAEAELAAGIATEDDVKVSVRTKFTSEGALDSREVEYAERRERTAMSLRETRDQQ